MLGESAHSQASPSGSWSYCPAVHIFVAAVFCTFWGSWNPSPIHNGSLSWSLGALRGPMAGFSEGLWTLWSYIQNIVCEHAWFSDKKVHELSKQFMTPQKGVFATLPRREFLLHFQISPGQLTQQGGTFTLDTDLHPAVHSHQGHLKSFCRIHKCDILNLFRIRSTVLRKDKILPLPRKNIIRFV